VVLCIFVIIIIMMIKFALKKLKIYSKNKMNIPLFLYFFPYFFEYDFI